MLYCKGLIGSYERQRSERKPAPSDRSWAFLDRSFWLYKCPDNICIFGLKSEEQFKTGDPAGMKQRTENDREEFWEWSTHSMLRNF